MIRHRVRQFAGVLVLGATAACTGGGGARPGPADAQEESRLESATRPARSAQIFFDWNMTDRDARFNGRGVLRIDPGYRVRVDLFGPRGETLAAAVVTEQGMRVVPPAAAALLPPPALLWSTLGVFRRPTDAPLTATARSGGVTTLEYERDGLVWRFRFREDRLISTEWTDGTGRRTVEVQGGTTVDTPERATFRDWTEFRELTLRVTEVEARTTEFEPDVWILPGER